MSTLYSTLLLQHNSLAFLIIHGLQIRQIWCILHLTVVVNFLSPVIFAFLLFLGMVIYANEVRTNDK